MISDPLSNVGEPASAQPEEVVAALSSNANAGLSEDEARQRLILHGPNELVAAEQAQHWLLLLAQFNKPLIYLMFAAIGVSTIAWAVESTEPIPVDALVISAIVLLNAAIGYVQERRAEDESPRWPR